MKVVVNRCFGGFGLSVAAIKELVLMGRGDLVGEYPIKKFYGKSGKAILTDWEGAINIGDGFLQTRNEIVSLLRKDDLIYTGLGSSDSKYRSDPDLVRLVEEKGSKFCSGHYAKLEVVHIPDDVDFEITDYDGMESIEEAHRSW